jgi:hypothetical protein
MACKPLRTITGGPTSRPAPTGKDTFKPSEFRVRLKFWDAALSFALLHILVRRSPRTKWYNEREQSGLAAIRFARDLTWNSFIGWLQK